MRRIFGLLLSLAIASGGIASGCRSSQADARALAESAYYALKNSYFETDTLRAAALRIEKAKQADPREPWVHIAESELFLHQGYLIGDWFDSSTFAPGTLDKVLDAALRAYELDSSNNAAAASLARVYIIRGDNQTAFSLMRKVYELDPADFHPPFLLGQIYLKSAHPEQAIPHLEQAERVAQRSFQKLSAMRALTIAYGLCHRPAEEERLFKELIRLEPDNAYRYEHYGHFLERQGRLDEAIANYRKGAALKPYPNILTLLHEAKRKSDSLYKSRM